MNQPDKPPASSGSSAAVAVVLTIVFALLVLLLVCGGILFGFLLLGSVRVETRPEIEIRERATEETAVEEATPDQPAASPPDRDPARPTPGEEPGEPKAEPATKSPAAKPSGETDAPADVPSTGKAKPPGEAAPRPEESPDSPDEFPVFALEPSEVVGVRTGDSPLRRTVAVDGTPHPALWAQPENDRGTSQLSLPLQGKYVRLQGRAAIADGGAENAVEPAATFRIYGDGNLLWESETLRRYGVSQPFEVDVTGMALVALVTESDASSQASPLAWVDLRLDAPAADQKPAE
jgi:hypothetical protein